MDSNPYKPPSAAVADPRAEAAPAPLETRRALRLLWLGFAVGLFSVIPAIRGPIPGAEELPAGLYFGLVAVFGVLFVALVVLVSRRHSWARWVLVAFLFLGWASLVTDFSATFAASPIAALLDVAVSGMEIVACYFLFTRPSNAWFRGERTPGSAH